MACFDVGAAIGLPGSEELSEKISAAKDVVQIDTLLPLGVVVALDCDRWDTAQLAAHAAIDANGLNLLRGCERVIADIAQRLWRRRFGIVTAASPSVRRHHPGSPERRPRRGLPRKELAVGPSRAGDLRYRRCLRDVPHS